MVYFSDYNWSDETILVADGYSYSLDLMRRILKTAGAEVILTTSADEALKKLQQNNDITIAIIDDALPGKKGKVLVAEAAPGYPEIDFFLTITNPYAKFDDLDIFKNVDIITKPIPPKMLMSKLNKKISNKIKGISKNSVASRFSEL